MRKFVTSDTHFGHERVLDFDERPFETIEEHDQKLIEYWNQVVGPGDTVFHLGDFALYKDPAQGLETARQLNGAIILVRGNHDTSARCKALSERIKVVDYLEIKYNKRRFVLCHYPIEVWRGMEHGSIHLHGHCHGGGSRPCQPIKNRVDMCSALWRYWPVSLERFAPGASRALLV